MSQHEASGAGPDPHGEGEAHIHMPGPSWYPFLLSFFLTVAMFGLLAMPHYGDTSASVIQIIVFLVLAIVGAAGVIGSIIGWAVQISEA